MRAYFLRRLLLIPVTLLGVTLIVFGITRVLPGGPLEQALAEAQNMKAGRFSGSDTSLSQEQQEQLKRYYGFDKFWLHAYAIWLGILPREVNVQTVIFSPNEFQKTVSIPTIDTDDNEIEQSASVEIIATHIAEGKSPFPVVAMAPGGSYLRDWHADWEDGSMSEKPEVSRKVRIFQKKFDGILQGNLGNSFVHNLPVWDVIVSRFPVSIYFGILTLIITYSTCIPLGIIKALKHKAFADNFSSILIFLGFAIPGYALAVCLQYIFSFKYSLLPHSGFRSENFESLSFFQQIADQLSHTILPLICYLIGAFAFMTMLMKNELMNNLAADYVRTAVAKGASFRQAVLRHAFPNSLIPIATSFGNSISALVMGSFLIETIFDINGFGLLSYNAIVSRDFPVVLGCLLISAFLMLLGNVLSDICVALTDPRIRFK